MPPTLADRVRHILEAIGEIEGVLANTTYDAFASDRVLRAAVERFLERISEATRHIPDDVKTQAPAIPWKTIIDFGNRLRHAYHSVDPKIVWQIATTDLEPLRNFVEAILRREDG
jgi:uncharacterized protein with HEPN domain